MSKKNLRLILFLLGIILISAGIYFNTRYFSNHFKKSLELSQRTYYLILIVDGLLIALGLSCIYFWKKILKNIKPIVYTSLSIVLILILTEVSLKLWLCYFSSERIFSNYALYGECNEKSMFEPHPYLSYVLTPNYKSKDGLNFHNSLGYRGEEISPKKKDTFRIVLIGGSTTYDYKINDYKNTSSFILEQILKDKGYDVEVINAGVPGYNSWQSLVNFEFNILEISPNLIIVNDGLNDIGARLVSPYSYKSDNSGTRKNWEYPSYPNLFNLMIIRIILGKSVQRLDMFVNTEEGFYPLINNEKFNEVLNMTPLDAIKSNKPDYFLRNLKSLIAIGKTNNVSIALMTLSSNEAVLERDYIKYGIQQTNDLIINLGNYTNISVIRYDLEMSKEDLFWADGLHVNEVGARKKAEIIGNFLTQNKVIN